MRAWGEQATHVKMSWPRLSSWNLIHTNASHYPFASWLGQIRLQHTQVSKYKLIANQLVWHPKVSQPHFGRDCDCWPDPPNWHVLWQCCHVAPAVQEGLALTLQAQASWGQYLSLQPQPCKIQITSAMLSEWLMFNCNSYWQGWVCRGRPLSVSQPAHPLNADCSLCWPTEKWDFLKTDLVTFKFAKMHRPSKCMPEKKCLFF